MQVYKAVRFAKAEALTIYAASNEYHPAWYGREDYGYALETHCLTLTNG